MKPLRIVRVASGTLAAFVAVTLGTILAPGSAHAVEFCLREGILTGRNPWISPWRRFNCDDKDCIRLQRVYLTSRQKGYICAVAPNVRVADDWCINLFGTRYVAQRCGGNRLCFG